MMKKTLLGLALIVATMGAHAQKSNVSYGIKGGVNVSNQTLGSTNELAGYKVGVFAEYALSPSFAIQPGLEFSTKGHESKLGGKTQANYLEMPIMAVYKIPVSPGFKINFNAGPYAAYRVYGKSSIVGMSFDGGHTLNYWDFGVGGGVGAEFGRILFNIGYEYGFSDIYNGPGKHGYNMNAFATLGFRF